MSTMSEDKRRMAEYKLYARSYVWRRLSENDLRCIIAELAKALCEAYGLADVHERYGLAADPKPDLFIMDALHRCGLISSADWERYKRLYGGW